mgnify:CR=1 FL=1
MVRIDADDVDITRHRVIPTLEFRVVLSRPELDVVASEEPASLQVVINDLSRMSSFMDSGKPNEPGVHRRAAFWRDRWDALSGSRTTFVMLSTARRA